MTNLKKLLAVVLCAALLLCHVPMVAFATDAEITAPEFYTEYPTVIYEREGIYWDNLSVTGNTAIANGSTQYVCFNEDSSTIDTTDAEYLEFDVYSSVAISNILNLWLSVNVWEESGRARFDLPALNAGWNHVAINLSDVKEVAEWANLYDRSIILSMHVRGTPETETNDAITMLFANAAFTTSAVLAPEMNNTYTSIYEREGIYWDNLSVTGNTAIANGSTQYVCFNEDSSTIDTTEAEYLEFDVYSSVAINNTLNLWLSVNIWEESGRALFEFPALNAGWNHVVINLAEVKNLAEWANKYDRSIILSMHVRGTPVTETNDAITMLFANAAFTVEAPTPEMNNTHAFSALEREGIFWEWYQEAGVITDWSDYTCFTEDKSAHDLSEVDYLEMDVYTKTAFPGANLWLSITTGDEGGRALFAFPALNVGWNHVIIDINEQLNVANFNGYTYTKSALKSMRLGDNLTFECDYLLKFANLAFTTDTVLAPDASYENILVKEYPEIKDTNEYTGGDLLFASSSFSGGLDLNKADTVEFDFYVSADAVNDLNVIFTDTNGVTATATVSANLLKSGWNHIVLADDEIVFGESYEKKSTSSVRFAGTLLSDETVILMASYANFAITAIAVEHSDMVYVGKKISVYDGYENVEVPTSANIADVAEPITLPIPLNLDAIDYVEFNIFVEAKCDVTVNLNATPLGEGEIYEEANAYYTVYGLNYGWTQVHVPVSDLVANGWFDATAINYIYFSGVPSTDSDLVITIADLALTSVSQTFDIAEGDYNADGSVDMLDLIYTVNSVLAEENVWFANVAEIETAANGIIDAVDVTAVKKLLFTMF